MIQRFRLGFADQSLGRHFPRKGGRRSELIRGSLQRLGLLKPTGFQFFQGDVVFPFFDIDGRIVGAYGRRISVENRSTHLYHHHWNVGNATFFNREALSRFKRIIHCKSPMEAFTLICAGVPNVIATMGIYSFGETHLSELEKHGVSEVVLGLDNTDTGNHVAGLISQALSASDIQCLRLKLPKGCDINQLAQQENDHEQVLKDIVEGAFPCHQTYENLLRR